MVLKEIQDRFSLRNFSEKMPSDEIIKDILEAARLAPSWVNAQPWHFIVIKDQETKDLLKELSHGQPHVANSPVVIACCGDYTAWNRKNYEKVLRSRPGIAEEKINMLLDNPLYNPSLKDLEAMKLRTVEEVTYAVAYMTLEATNQGLGTCVIGAIGNELTESVPETYKKVKSLLNLTDNQILSCLLLLGYPADDVKILPKSRKTPDEIFSLEKFGNKY